MSSVKEIYIVPRDRIDLIEEKKHSFTVNHELSVGELLSDPEGEERGGWHIHGSDIDDYQDTFASVLESESLHGLLKDIGGRDPSAILDLMASETVVREAVENYGFNLGTSVSLGFPETHERTSSGVIRNVNGDLLHPQTWEDLHALLLRRKARWFDVILSRPEGGLNHLSLLPSTHLRLLQESWKLLNPDGGVLLFQAPDSTFNKFGQPYLDQLKNAGVAEVAYTYLGDAEVGHPVMITKTSSSPALLPTPKMLGMKI